MDSLAGATFGAAKKSPAVSDASGDAEMQGYPPGAGRPAPPPTYRLFVYGTLLEPRHVRALTGKEFHYRDAVLRGFEKVAGASAYPFVLPKEGRTVRGKVIEGLDADSVRRIDEYEGEGHLYYRQQVSVVVEGQEVPAYTYVGNPRAFGVHDVEVMEPEERVEEYLAERLRHLLEAEVSDEASAALRVRTKAELLGGATEEMLQAQFEGTLPPHLLRYALSRQPGPSLRWLAEEPEAQRYAQAYLRLIVRQTVFNEVEDKVRREFRPLTRTAPAFHQHMCSSLVALRYLNERQDRLEQEIAAREGDRYVTELDYSDYVAAGVVVAETLYEHQQAADTAQWVSEHRRRGGTPIGAEVELSNLGRRTIGAVPGQEPLYDCFYYFHDFDLTRRLWKLGGYRDDHKFVTPSRERSRGFLEFALGRYRIVGDLSRPATYDPWLLARLIEEIVRFVPVAPHSVHFSIDPPPGRSFTPCEHPSDLICLLLLGGDLAADAQGRLTERRIHQGEIVSPYTGLEFSRLNYHRRLEGAEDVAVVEFVFPRLRPAYDYEPLIFALKGMQWATNPLPLVAEGEQASQQHGAELAATLTSWAAEPSRLSDEDIAGFLARVEAGLVREAEESVGHRKEYIARQLSEIESQIRRANELVAARQRRSD